MLDIWPELPIYIYDCDFPTKDDRDSTSAAAALTLNHRVSRIRLGKTSLAAWELFAPLMHRPFPMLTHLWVSIYPPTTVEISRSFLGGSAPFLQDLVFSHVLYPGLPDLLLSATNLVRLWYDNILDSISSRAMVTGLSALTRLESLSLTFRSPEPLMDRVLPIPLPYMRTLLPSLTYLRLRGVPEFVDDLVAQFDARLLESMEITLFRREVLEVPELAKFVRRADKLSAVDRAEITVKYEYIAVNLSQELPAWRVDSKTLRISLVCGQPGLRLPYLTQFCASCLPALSPFEHLHILLSTHCTWSGTEALNPDSQWLEFSRLFDTVKGLHLSQGISSRVAQALRRLPAGRVTEVLPALEIVFISGLESCGLVTEAIYEYAAARQLSGHPVSIYDWDHDRSV